VKYLITLVLILTSINTFSKNLGHRAGGGKGEYYSHLPENSLSALEASLLELQYDKDFVYLEFDIQETKDGEVVIFHDKYIRRMISKKQNKEELDQIYSEIGASFIKRKFNLIKIKDLTYEQLMRLHLTDHPSQRVPTLDEYIEKSEELGLIKPMTVELKYLHSSKAKLEVIRKLKEFNNSYMKGADIIFEDDYDMPFRTGFLAWKSKFKKVFGKDPKWCQRVKEAGLHGVFKPGSHKNQCP
jgi:glycerophosphoryl diester phosphodiesterase